MLEELRETEWIVTRHHPKYYPFMKENESSEGQWYKRTNVLGTHVENIGNLHPMDRFEFKEDGTWAQVYEMR
jgi:hypothetical protein